MDRKGRTWLRYPAEFAQEPPPGSEVIRTKDPDAPEPVRDYLGMSDEEVAELIRPVTLVGQYEYRLQSPPLKEARELKETMRQQNRGELPLSQGEPSETTSGPIEEELQGQGANIIDWDGRAKKRANLDFPWRTILYVTDYATNTQHLCTAQLIGRSTATSVAHCFHTGNAWKPARVMATGVDGEDANPFPDGIMNCFWAVTISGAWDGDPEYDFAVLESSNMFPGTCNMYPGDWAGWLGWKSSYAPSSSQSGYMYGFPYSACPGASDCNRPQIWGMGANNMDEDGWNVDHYVDASDGQSGAALYVIINNNRYLIGNHYGGYSNAFDEWNEARRLSDVFYTYLKDYTAQ